MSGNDGTDSVQQAIAHGEQSVKLSPDLDFSALNLGVAYANLAEHNLKDKAKFSAELEKSRKALQNTLKINAQYPEAYFTLGRLDFLSAREKAQLGTSPIPDLEKAREAFAKALQLNPAYIEARNVTTETYRMQIEWKLARKENPEKEMKEAISINQQAISQDPRDSVALAEEAALLFLKAGSTTHPQERADLETQSSELMRKALEINANLKSKYSNYDPSLLGAKH